MLATSNPRKAAELRALLDALLGEGAYALATPKDYPGVAEPEETGSTFEENALIKARYWARVAGTLALADDSGLVVDALDGRPGTRSARYAETVELRNRRVLEEMAEVADDRRAARFVCVAALADPNVGQCLCRGEVVGAIARAPRGQEGFGYDPVFELAESASAGLTLAEIDKTAKNALSHRGRALAAIAPALAASLRAGRVAAD
jgi:XTP/dITP diphosphohydrolase